MAFQIRKKKQKYSQFYYSTAWTFTAVLSDCIQASLDTILLHWRQNVERD